MHGYNTVREACVVIPSKRGASSGVAWQRQCAAARELSVLPNNMEAALEHLRTAKATLPRDIVNHLEGRCHKCGEKGHMAYACPNGADGGTSARGSRESGPRKRTPKKTRAARRGTRARPNRTIHKKGRRRSTGVAMKKTGASRVRAAKNRGHHADADRIKYGKKGKVASRRVDNRNYRAKPGYNAKKHALDKARNSMPSVKAKKKRYDQSDAAKRKRR